VSTSALALVPLLSAILYVLLWRLARKNAPTSAGRLEFQMFVASQGVSSLCSVAWRLTSAQAHDYTLRLLLMTGMFVGSTFLAFVAARHATKWTRKARLLSLATAAVVAIGTLSGAASRALTPDAPPPAMWHLVAGYGALAALEVANLAAFVYLIAAYRSQRDPFERNRLKYVGLAAGLILLGAHTNVVPALQRLPVDQGVYAAASSLLFFSLIRYRLFDIAIVLKRGMIAAAAAVLLGPVYVAALFAYGAASGDLMTPAGFAVGLGLMIPTALAGYYVRATVQVAVDRLFVGRHAGRELAEREFNTRIRSAHTLNEVGVLVSEVCQLATASSFATVMLDAAGDGVLRVTATSGPFAPSTRITSLSVGHPLVRTAALSDQPATPLQVRTLLASETLSEDESAEVAQWSDCVIQPIIIRESVDGLIMLGPSIYDTVPSIEDMDFLARVSEHAALAIENARLFEALQKHAETDYLTGLPNHRHFQDVLGDLLSRAEQTGEPFCVAMIDIDNFKLLNDVHGHVVGDEAIRKVASTLRSAVRPVDVVARYGGDEFVVLLPGLAKDKGRAIVMHAARRIRRMAFSPGVASPGDLGAIPMRISWGVATYPQDATSKSNLVAAADSDLLKQRFQRGRSGTLQTRHPVLEGLLGNDVKKLRVAQGLIDLIDAKDPYTAEHSQQVASLALLLADHIGLSSRERHALWLGGLLHDVGKLSIRDDILRKPGLLTPSEWIEMRQHPTRGGELIDALLDMREIAEIVRCHHERFDGSGYPHGLIGEEIPALARAVAVVDAFSAMVHDRPYRKGLTGDEAIRELQLGKGTQFDPVFVDNFVEAVGRVSEPVAVAG
jgi:diguanylate cyclase (GGDEF)-like protein/putative nucleotidyltransferase with HDIG domain